MKVAWLAIVGLLVLLGAAQAQECPPDAPAVPCFVDPCLTATCPNVPTATCQADYCGGCNARWYVNGGTVDVTRNCTTTDPCAAVSCLAPSCPNPYTPPGQCCPRCPNNSTSQVSCPVPEPGSIGICITTCSDNSSCPGSQLCCSNGCGWSCVDPVVRNTTGVTCTGPNGRLYQPGETYTAADGCNTCTCGSSGVSICTLRACPLTCVDEAGNRYSVGQTFPAGDGCNNCTCTSTGAIACTLRACVDICSLSPETGLCDALFPRYFFNRTSGLCERFIYGGCGGNQNRFTTAGDCYRQCNASSVCIQPTYPPDFQPVCLVIQRKWAFNSDAGRCEAISYSSCGQDRVGYNVFDTEAECNRTCVRAEDTVTCSGPDGRRYRPGDTYAAADGCNTCTCTSTGLSACTEIACLPTCVYQQTGNRYYAGQSFPSADGCNNCTCTSSGAIICTLRACVDVCSLPPETGMCLAAFRKYFYNRTSMRCELFIYGGCGGNQNRFNTVDDCNRRCNPSALLPSPTLTGVCPRVSEDSSGLCVEACTDDDSCQDDQMCCSNGCGHSCFDPDRIPYYDIPRQCPTFDDSDLTTGTCVLTNASCLSDDQCDNGELCCQSGCGRRCMRSVVPSQPCRAISDRFRLVNRTVPGRYVPQCDSTNGTFQPYQCHPSTGYCWCVNTRSGQPISGFYPRGVRPNCTTCSYNNRLYNAGDSFPSSDGCNICQCSSTGVVLCTLRACIDTCSLPPETGPCRAAISAYYYDRGQGACLPFTYGGCGGNDNKFQTIADCLRRCDPDSRCLRAAPICIDTFNSSVDTGYYTFNATSGRCERFPSGCASLPFFINQTQCQECNPGSVPDPCATVRCARPDCMEDHWITDPDACCPRCRPPAATECDEDEFRCSDTSCISSRWVCDGIRDCDDGRDEAERQCPRNGTCSGHSCGDGVCIPSDYVCDDYLDCRDASDEANCTLTVFENTYYPLQLPSRCPNSTSLIGLCVEECSSDNPCENNLLCCSNGCGHSCMPGQIVAPLCPALLRQSSGGIGAFVPQCEEDGSFSSVQCWGSTGYCWCVESTSGRPISEGVRGEPDCPGCIVDDVTYPFGERFADKDGCNTCYCSSSGVAVCTREACAPVSCQLLDREVPHGQTLDETCFTCMCLSGLMNCTRKKCAVSGAVSQKPPTRIVMGFGGNLDQLAPTDNHKEDLKREVMKALLNRYKDRLGLTQDQITEIELMKGNGISIGVTFMESQNTSTGADVPILIGQMQQDYQSRALVIRYNRAVLEPSGDFQINDGGEVSGAGFPWWGILIIVAGALVLVAAVSVVVMAVVIKSKGQSPHAAAESNDYGNVSFKKSELSDELKLPLDEDKP